MTKNKKKETEYVMQQRLVTEKSFTMTMISLVLGLSFGILFLLSMFLTGFTYGKLSFYLLVLYFLLRIFLWSITEKSVKWVITETPDYRIVKRR